MNMAPTLPAARGSLPPEGAAAPAARLSRFRGPGWREALARRPALPFLDGVSAKLHTAFDRTLS